MLKLHESTLLFYTAFPVISRMLTLIFIKIIKRETKLETIFYRDLWIPEYLAGLWKLLLEILLVGLVHNQIYN